MKDLNQRTLDGIINNTAKIGETVDKIKKESSTRDLILSQIINNQNVLDAKLRLIIKHLNINTD